MCVTGLFQASAALARVVLVLVCTKMFSIHVNMAIQHSSLKLEMGTTELLMRNTALTMMLMLFAYTKRMVFFVFCRHSESSARMTLTTTFMAHVEEVFAYSLRKESIRFSMPALVNASCVAATWRGYKRNLHVTMNHAHV